MKFFKPNVKGRITPAGWSEKKEIVCPIMKMDIFRIEITFLRELSGFPRFFLK